MNLTLKIKNKLNNALQLSGSNASRGALAASIISQVDRIIKYHLNYDLKVNSCKKACSYCCFYEVKMTEDEYLLIRSQFGIDSNYIPQLIKQKKESWNNIPYPERKCIFLVNNECSIYDSRPIECRMHFVKNIPVNCSEENNIWNTRVKYDKFNPEIERAAILILRDQPKLSLSSHVLNEIHTLEEQQNLKKSKSKKK